MPNKNKNAQKMVIGTSDAAKAILAGKTIATNVAGTVVNKANVSNGIASSNKAGAVATANVLKKLTEERETARLAKLAASPERSKKAALLVTERKLTNMLKTAAVKKAAKKDKKSSTTATKAAKYGSIYEGVKNMHLLAAMLLKNKATQAEIAKAFITAYGYKNVTDLTFIAGRITIYLKHATTLDLLKGLQAAAVVPAVINEPAADVNENANNA